MIYEVIISYVNFNRIESREIVVIYNIDVLFENVKYILNYIVIYFLKNK